MGADFWIVLQWWGTLFLVGALAYPLTKKLFSSWFDHGYLFSKAVGMAAVTWIVYVLGTLRVMPFTVLSIIVALIVVFILGLLANLKNKELRIKNYGSKTTFIQKIHTGFSLILHSSFLLHLFEELFFLIALLFWSWIKAHEPSIRGLEKFMDFGFMQSILNSKFFPPADMWYAGLPINYYYFGHLVTATTTKLSGLDLAYTFNLMLATIFALTITMSFSIGKQIGGRGGGMLTAFLVTMAGNMQTIYAFTKGYTGDPPAGGVKPFWELGWNIREIGGIGAIWGKLGEGMNIYWYANATRFIPFTIHEFPSYSFVVSDVHGHVLSIPFVLLAIAILIRLFHRENQYPGEGNSKHEARNPKQIPNSNVQNSKRFGFRILGFDIVSNFDIRISDLIFYGFLVGVLLMTNALDGPIYFTLFGTMLIIRNWKRWKQIALSIGGVLLVAGITSLPFLIHFKSFVTGVAVNCPPAFLTNTKFGPLIFEGVEKCQISPFWMWWLLWGFFVYCGGWLVGRRIREIRGIREIRVETLLIIFFVFALALVIVPEFFYFKDIYPAHFRSNTMFKLGYQAFILFSIVSGYAIIKAIRGKRKLFLILLLPQLILVSIFPIFAVRSYFNNLKRYQGIYGLNWMAREYPDDWDAIEWMKLQTENGKRKTENNVAKKSFPFTVYRLPSDRFAIVEADGDSYTDYGRFSSFTGIPTIIGWPVHEWLWRGSYDLVAPRREEVRIIYESEDIDETKKILAAYNVSYIVVGKLEREKYKSLQEWKFGQLGAEVFRSGSTAIYKTY